MGLAKNMRKQKGGFKKGGRPAAAAPATAAARAPEAAAPQPVKKKKRVEADPEEARKRDREEFDKALEANGSFADLGLSPRVVEALARIGKYAHPTAVQREAIPAFLTGADVLVRSETGSGKTLSYIIPILDALTRLPDKISRADGTFVVVIAPTRELVVQIVEDVQAITRQGMNWIVPGFLIGGEKKKSEKARLRKGVTILVATPGQAVDHLRTTESFKLQHLSFLVFDEADRLLDMGFEQDVRAITDMLKNKSRSDRVPQTALISATLWDKVMTLASLALHNPVTINVYRPNEYTLAGAAPKRAKAGGGGAEGEEARPNTRASTTRRSSFRRPCRSSKTTWWCRASSGWWCWRPLFSGR